MNLIGTTFPTAILALCAAAAWGSGNFTSRIAARRIETRAQARTLEDLAQEVLAAG